VAILSEAAARSGLRRLRATQPIGLLILANDPTPAYGMHMLAYGATCLARNTSIADLLGAIHLTAQGIRVFVSLAGQRVERRYPSNARLLTKRESEVFELLSEGRTNPEIADALQISVETARTHVTRTLRKLDVQSRRELIGMST
jgi:DNA-binding NarL/FixJ family response regulator